MRIIHPCPARSIDAPVFERLTPRLKDSKQHFIGAGSARLAVNDDGAHGRHGAPRLDTGNPCDFLIPPRLNDAGAYRRGSQGAAPQSIEPTAAFGTRKIPANEKAEDGAHGRGSSSRSVRPFYWRFPLVLRAQELIPIRTREP
jgi:hypothetical protein